MARSATIAAVGAALAAAAARLPSGPSLEIAVASGGFRSPPPHRHSSGAPVKPYRLTGNKPHQGAREIERRRKRMENAKAKGGEG